MFIKGMDVSTLPEIEKLGGRFYSCGEEKELFAIMKSYSVNSVRLRLWNDPYDESGHPYGGGTCDIDNLLLLAKRAKKAGMSICLDFHYSDFWADPGKQLVPKAWRGLDANGLEKAVYDCTKETLIRLKGEEIVPEYIQVGNEIAHGMLWPLGMYGENTENLIRFVRSGCRAVREYAPDAKIILHFDNGGDNEHCRAWYEDMRRGGVDYDIIGLSYYPVFHGTFDKLEHNVNDLIRTFDKDIIIAETSYGFAVHKPEGYSYTDDDYDVRIEKPACGMTFENAPAPGKPGEDKDFMFAQQSAAVTGYPVTPEGQTDYYKEFFDILKNRIEGKRVVGFYYWEPAWLPVKGSTWATRAGRAYCADAGAGGNEWANQCLFDYNGNALPAWDVIRDLEL